MDRRTVRRLLARAGVTFLDSGRVVYVPLSEIEVKAPVFWEGVKAAQALRDTNR
jgi:hypothetical protein